MSTTRKPRLASADRTPSSRLRPAPRIRAPRARDLETATSRYAPRYCDYIDWVGGELLPWGLEPVLPPGVDPPRLPPADFDTLRTEGPLVVGAPQQVLDRLAGFMEACDLDRYIFHVDSGALPQEDLFESLDLLSAEVLPHLRGS